MKTSNPSRRSAVPLVSGLGLKAFLTGLCATASLLALPFGSALSLNAQTTSVATVPEGYVTWELPDTTTGQITSYLSVPLTSAPSASGMVSSVTANTMTVLSANWVSNWALPSAPYYVRFTSGYQVGRVLLITANTSNSLTVDTADSSSSTTALNLSGFSVAANDKFEIFAGDTLATFFGDNTVGNSVLIQSSGTLLNADTIGIYDDVSKKFISYFFNSAAGKWRTSGTLVDKNDVILPPYSAIALTRRSGRSKLSISISGRVPAITPLCKFSDAGSARYTATQFPVDMTLGQLNIPGWVGNNFLLNADTISLWNDVSKKWDAYYKNGSNQWRISGNSTVDKSGIVIPATSAVIILKRTPGTGSSGFVSVVPSGSLSLPYSL